MSGCGSWGLVLARTVSQVKPVPKAGSRENAISLQFAFVAIVGVGDGVGVGVSVEAEVVGDGVADGVVLGVAGDA